MRLLWLLRKRVAPPSLPACEYVEPRSGKRYPLGEPRWCGDGKAADGQPIPLMLTELPGIRRKSSRSFEGAGTMLALKCILKSVAVKKKKVQQVLAAAPPLPPTHNPRPTTWKQHGPPQSGGEPSQHAQQRLTAQSAAGARLTRPRPPLP